MGRITYPLPPAGYYPYLRGRVSYNRKHRASLLPIEGEMPERQKGSVSIL